MSVRIVTGDALTELRRLPDESVNCCVTSPPYYGLRDYGTAQWGGGDPTCDHKQGKMRHDADKIFPTSGPDRRGSFGGGDQHYRDTCGKCGASRIDRQIGLEPSPDEYVAALVAVFREARRVLRKDGTLWLNIGDSYANQKTGDIHKGFNDRYFGRETDGGKQAQTTANFDRSKRFEFGCKPKDLIGIPWLVAFALRADGWWLRQDIIWSKPNPMPESVTDRCTKAHEYLFLLSKNERYWFDADAIAEPNGGTVRPSQDGRRLTQALVPGSGAQNARCGNGSRQPRGKALTSPRNDGNTWNENNGRGFLPNEFGTRNKRSVWTVTSEPFSEAHFATFPPALIEPCILAGCPKGGAVLDPFGGAGTTGLVADRLGRDAVLIELNDAYAKMAERRIHGDAPLFADVAMSGATQLEAAE